MKYPSPDPIALDLGTWHLFGTTWHPAIHWYGIMYLIGFFGGWLLMARRAKRPGSGWTVDQVSDLLVFAVLGVVLGGRLGYFLFYATDTIWQRPWEILMLQHGGMSFHGGLLGVLIAMWWYGKRTGRHFFAITDFIAPVVPIGLAAGRLGNFINGELWGKVTDLPWGMQLNCADPRFVYYCKGQVMGWSAPHHPSQLYEMALEGITLFLILWFFSAKPRPRMAVSGMFALFYGIFRFLVEFVRIPDQQLGYLEFGWLTMGQILSFPMILFGIYLIWRAYRRPVYDYEK